MDNSAARNEAKKALADGGKARQVSPGIHEQADKKSQAILEETPQLKKPAAANGVLRDVQLVSRQVVAVDSLVASDLEPASVPQSEDKKISTSASSPDSRSEKPNSAEKHMATPASLSASPQALRSVPARPLQTELTPLNGDSNRSRAPLMYPAKKHEGPRVQIGQIDVIVEAAAQPARKSAAAPASVDLASRHYLRRP